jgi:hypothetical protein
LGLGEVDGGSSFCSQCGLALIRSAGHRWLLAHRQAGHDVEPLAALPGSLAIEWEEFHPWLQCHIPHHDCWKGLQCCGVLRCRFSGDGDSRCYHVVPSRFEGSRAPPAPEAVPSLLEESLRVVCKDNDPLRTIPMKVVPENCSLGERLRWPRKWAVNSRLPK